ncbi:unnamed protein product [Cylicostephanus goldi]|uniref:Uncharacterized protein n=1 Tax=Cylicostephanus goldi TaxID=71465 RepID=A0A3P6R708_CYLGO|nr:unnamed protein product [Cylicostephanus goldi]
MIDLFSLLDCSDSALSNALSLYCIQQELLMWCCEHSLIPQHLVSPWTTTYR